MNMKISVEMKIIWVHFFIVVHFLLSFSGKSITKTTSFISTQASYAYHIPFFTLLILKDFLKSDVNSVRIDNIFWTLENSFQISYISCFAKNTFYFFTIMFLHNSFTIELFIPILSCNMYRYIAHRNCSFHVDIALFPVVVKKNRKNKRAAYHGTEHFNK